MGVADSQSLARKEGKKIKKVKDPVFARRCQNFLAFRQSLLNWVEHQTEDITFLFQREDISEEEFHSFLKRLVEISRSWENLIDEILAKFEK